MWWIAANRSGWTTDLANNDLANCVDHSLAKKTGIPRSSINTQMEQKEKREKPIHNIIILQMIHWVCYAMQNFIEVSLWRKAEHVFLTQ